VLLARCVRDVILSFLVFLFYIIPSGQQQLPLLNSLLFLVPFSLSLPLFLTDLRYCPLTLRFVQLLPSSSSLRFYFDLLPFLSSSSRLSRTLRIRGT